MRRRRHAPAQRLAAAERTAQDAEHALNRYRDNDTIARLIRDTAFLDGLAVRHERLREARLKVIDARAAARLHELPSVPELRAQLPTMLLDQRRDLVRMVVEVVFVGPGRTSAAHRCDHLPRRHRTTATPTPRRPRGHILKTIETSPRLDQSDALPAATS